MGPLIVCTLMIPAGLYAVVWPEKAIHACRHLPMTALDRKHYREALRDSSGAAGCTMRVVGVVLMLIGGLLLYASQQG